MIDVSIIITGIIGLIATVVSSWCTWFFARRKYNSEVDRNLILNLLSSLDFYKTLVDDNTLRLDEMILRNHEQESRMDELLRRNDNLEIEISTMRKLMFDMMANICLDLSCAIRIRDKKVIKDEPIKNE